MAKTHSNSKTPERAGAQLAYTSGLLRFRPTEPSTIYCHLSRKNRFGWK